MNTANSLSTYFKKRVKNINTLLCKPLNEYDKEDYHQLRVEIKKLHAVMCITDYCTKNFKRKKYFKPFKKVFKQCGRIREFQIEEATLEVYESFFINNYLYKLKKRIQKEQLDLHSVINKKRKKKIKRSFKKMTPVIKELDEKKVNDFIEKKREKISDLILQKPLEPLQVHELRKKLKENFYNQNSLGQPIAEKLKEEDSFQEILGKWHDGRRVNDHLERSIIKEETDPQEIMQLIQIDEEIMAKTHQLLNKINAEIETKNLVG